MNRRLTSRVLAAALLGIILGLYIRHDYSKWRQRGREEFLLHQAARFDTFICSPKPVVLTMLGGVIVAFGIVGFYELMVAMISYAFRKMRLWPEDRSPQQTLTA
jgi:hypothetical protein